MKKVLIADDEYVTAELFRHIVAKRLKHEVVGVVHAGADAVEQTRALKPDVVFLDIKMESPLAGIDACKKIKKEFPHIKVFLLTAYSRTVLKETLNGVPCDGHIDKLNFSDVAKEILGDC